MRTGQLLRWPVAFGFFAVAIFSVIASGDPPTSAPADSPQVKELRDLVIQWDKDAPTWSLAETRKVFHTESDREAKYADFVAHETWEVAKTQKAVRDKWGPDAEAKFAHLLGTDTIEDDQAADITIDGDHAIMNWKVKEIQPTKLIRVDGHWLIAMHAMFADLQKNDPDPDKNLIPSGKLMKQAAADINDGKFDDADDFLVDFKQKYDALTGGN